MVRDATSQRDIMEKRTYKTYCKGFRIQDIKSLVFDKWKEKTKLYYLERKTKLHYVLSSSPTKQ